MLVKIKVLAPWVVVIKIVDAACVDVSRSVLVSTSVLAPWVVVIKTVDAGAVVATVADCVIVDAKAVVVSLGSVEVKTTVLAPWVVVIKIVVGGSVLPAAVETSVCV